MATSNDLDSVLLRVVARYYWRLFLVTRSNANVRHRNRRSHLQNFLAVKALGLARYQLNAVLCQRPRQPVRPNDIQ